MNLKTNLKIAFQGLKVHKSRSFLTILGIVIGITAIMLVMALGEGAQNLILSQIQGQVGSKVIEIRPGKEPKGLTDFMSIMYSDSLKQKDVDALKKKNNVPSATGIMPLVFGSESAVYGSETYQATLYGMSDLAVRMYALKPVVGRFLSEDEVRGYSDVVVIGDKTREELFANEEALNKKIKIKGKNFRVIGILGKKGQGTLFSWDETVIIPYTTAQQYILGTKYFQHIIVEADTEANINKVIEDIKITLRNSHNITDPEKDDFSIGSQADAIKMVGSVMSVLTLFLAAVAAISLVVGGVGIMNIMLVSVTERTREIGLRKAIGATEKNILSQFLLEATMLTGVGGLIGIGLGTALSFATAIILTRIAGLQWIFAFPLSAALMGIGVSVVIGLIFGIYPARQAAKKSPIEALRYE